MRLSAAKMTRANGRDAIATIGREARRLRDAGLPVAAAGIESTGKAVSGFALSTSETLAKTLRNRRGGIAANGAMLLQAAPLLRLAGRFALRNPALLAAAGVAIVMLGHSAWKRRQPEAPEADVSSVPAE